MPLLEAEQEHNANPADRQILDAAVLNEANLQEGSGVDVAINGNLFPDVDDVATATLGEPEVPTVTDPALETPAATDPFDEIDFGSFFDDYLDPGYRTPASESVEKPSFETFL